MKIGICGGIEKSDTALGLGYDYIEENLSAIVALSDEAFGRKLEKVRTSKIPVYAFNCFFTSDTPVLSDSFFEKAEAYAAKAFSRAGAMGAKICVIGSGKARTIPEGVCRESAEKRFIDILKIFGAEANKYGIKVVIEPLNKSETNFMTTVAEAAEIAKRCGLDNVGTMIDFHHFSVEHETGENLSEFGNLIYHAHIARSDPDRGVPKEEDKDDLKKWLAILKSINYNGAMSIEARYGDFESELSERRQYLAEFFKL